MQLVKGALMTRETMLLLGPNYNMEQGIEFEKVENAMFQMKALSLQYLNSIQIVAIQ